MSEHRPIAPSERTTLYVESSPVPKLEPMPVPNGDGVVVMVKDGFKPYAFPGPRVNRRTHVFDDLLSFAEYVNRHGVVDPERTEILVEPGRVVAAFDPSEVDGDRVVCDLVTHPRFMAWVHAIEPRRRLNSRELFALLRAQRGDLDAAVAEMLLASVRDVRITSGGTRQITTDELGCVRFVATSNNRSVAGTFPPVFSVSTPVFEGVRGVMAPETDSGGTAIPLRQEITYEFDVMLWMEEAGGDLVFELQAPTLDLLLREARRDAAAYLGALLDPRLLVGLGLFHVDSKPVGAATA